MIGDNRQLVTHFVRLEGDCGEKFFSAFVAEYFGHDTRAERPEQPANY